jgi:sugar phosphate permease
VAETKTAGRIHYGWIILILAVMTITGALGFARFGYAILYPPMQKGLGLDEVHASDLQAGNMTGYLIMALFCGMLATRFGPRIVITISLAIVALAMLLTGFAGNFASALAARVLTGMGSAGANVPVMGLVSAWFVAKRRGLATGIAVSGSSFGLLLTGLFLPLILARFGVDGWRYSWFALSACAIVFAAIGFMLIRNHPSSKKLESIGFEKTETTVDAQNASSPVQWSAIVKTPSVWHLAFIYILFGFSYIIYMTYYVRYTGGEAGFGKEQAGFFFALIGGFSIASGLLWGWVSDKIGRKFGLAIVFALQAASYLIFGLWKSGEGILVSSILFALTAWSIPAIMAATTGDILGPRLAPATLGFITFFFGIGQMMGPFAGGRIAQSLGSFGPVFIIAGCAALGGAIASLAIRKHEAHAPEDNGAR